MSKPSSSHPTNLKSVSKIWPWSNLLASPPLMNVYPWKVNLVLFLFFGSCFCFMDLPCTSCSRVHFSGDVYVVALLCHMEVSIVMGLSPWLWMVYFMENPSINGWWLGVPLWLRKPPYCLLLACRTFNDIVWPVTSCHYVHSVWGARPRTINPWCILR